MAEDYAQCTIECERMPLCATCGKRKAPRGRSIPIPDVGAFCAGYFDCKGYPHEPTPGHLWPRELAEIRRDEGRSHD
jgi:hypothetical protein